MRGRRGISRAGVKGRGLVSWGGFSRCMWPRILSCLQGQRAARTVKQHPACIRMLFDWLGAMPNRVPLPATPAVPQIDAIFMRHCRQAGQ